MNSRELKKRFPDEYRDFFSCCTEVVSAPHVFFWTGDFSNFYGGLAICSKIPLRFYVGLEKIAKDDFEVQEDFKAYFSSKNSFQSLKLDDYIVSALRSFLKDYFKGYRIRFFSELPLGSSLGALGAMSACLAKLTGGAKSIEYKAIDLSRSLQRGRKSAATALSCMIDSPYPVVYTHHNNKPTVTSLDKMLDLPKDAIWPIDFGLIFSGKLVRGGAVISSAREMQDVSRNLQREAKEILGSYSGSFWDDYLKMLNHVACQCLVGMKRIFRQAREDDIAFLFLTLNQYQNLLYFLGISTSTVNKIYSAVHKDANYLDNEVGSGCKITGVGRGGDVLFAVPYGEIREKIKKTIDRISRKDNGSVSLDYASWIDGIEAKGLIVEQKVSDGVFSAFLQKGMLLLEIFEGKSLSEKIINSEDIDREKIDLILDTDTAKIIFRGKKLNSSEIFSQKATVEILSKILRSDNLKITNDDLPVSYGKSRFDLQSKIISPLEKLTKLSFDIRGGMYDDFSLELKFSNISIGIVKKIS